MRDPVLAALGRRLAAQRHQKKVSQEVLAEKSGLSAKFISAVERGGANPSVRSVHQLAGALGVPMVMLLEDDAGREIAHLVETCAPKDRDRLMRIVKAYCER